jgi:hypothetical protein
VRSSRQKLPDSRWTERLALIRWMLLGVCIPKKTKENAKNENQYKEHENDANLK